MATMSGKQAAPMSGKQVLVCTYSYHLCTPTALDDDKSTRAAYKGYKMFHEYFVISTVLHLMMMLDHEVNDLVHM